jgi:hypothetical protein
MSGHHSLEVSGEGKGVREKKVSQQNWLSRLQMRIPGSESAGMLMRLAAQRPLQLIDP